MFNLFRYVESYSLKGVAFCLLFTLISVKIVAQESTLVPPSKVSINTGLMMGGGGLLGADMEALILPRVSCQLGVGLASFGGAVNYHTSSDINSSYFSLQYWQQGRASNHFASYLGPMFIYRFKGVFQTGIGYAYILDKGPANTRPDTNFALMIQLGLYFPL